MLKEFLKCKKKYLVKQKKFSRYLSFFRNKDKEMINYM